MEQEIPARIEATQNLIVEKFGALCADPDNAPIAAAADAALLELDQLLSDGAGLD